MDALGGGPKSTAVTWFPNEFILVRSTTKNKVTLKGRLPDQTKKIWIEGVEVKPNPDHRFETQIGFIGERKTVQVRTVDASGAQGEGRYEIKLSLDSQEPVESVNLGQAPERKPDWTGGFGIGYSAISYSQTYVESFHEKALTLKGHVERNLGASRFTFGLGGFYNVWVLSHPGELKIRVLGGNLRLGYRLLEPQGRFQTRLNFGTYFNTAVTDLGFKNMIGPQIFPEVSYRFQHSKMVTAYFKFSPILVGSSFNLKSDREVALGIGYRYLFLNGKSIGITLDYSQLDAVAGSIEAHTQTTTLGLGYGL